MRISVNLQFSKVFFSLTMMFVMILSVFSVQSASADDTFLINGITNSPKTFLSNAVQDQDGWVLESAENSYTGGSVNSTALVIRVGDDAQKRQYRGILSFNTAGLPDNAVVLSATLKLKLRDVVGENPFGTHKRLIVDIGKPAFGASAVLAPEDFQAKSERAPVAVISPEPVAGYFTTKIYKPALASINLAGFTQLRLRFELDDNNNTTADYLSFFSGNAADAAQKPVLEIQYYVPTLPKDLYYLASTGPDFNQIFRLAKDGKTVTQITKEGPFTISYYDISPVDGTIVYVLGNQIITVDRNGENRQVLFKGIGAIEIGRLQWSPDGKTILYQIRGDGFYLHTVATGKNTFLLSKGVDTNFIAFPPTRFSPDSKKFVISYLSTYPFGAIYNIAEKKVTKISEIAFPREAVCIGGITWTSLDSFLCSSGSAVVEIPPGLWRINANTGAVETLIGPSSNPWKLVALPWQSAPNKLQYLYSEPGQGTDFLLVSSDLDGITNRVALRPEKFSLSTAIWTPDHSGIVVLTNPWDGSNKELLLLPVNPNIPVAKFLVVGANKIFGSFRWGVQ